ncbi:MAG: hypothetical protein DSY85_16565 [Marinomonas sp.]|nr:MAG: hypothetical protein DSY85_16565 [Marinomonas sp.]
MEEVQKAFDRLTQSNNFSCIDNEDLKIVALAIWHSGFIPIVNDSISSIPVAGYVIDKLRRFSCVPQEAKCELTALTRILKSSLESEAEQKNLATNKRLDPLAIEWVNRPDFSRHFIDIQLSVLRRSDESTIY